MITFVHQVMIYVIPVTNRCSNSFPTEGIVVEPGPNGARMDVEREPEQETKPIRRQGRPGRISCSPVQ